MKRIHVLLVFAILFSFFVSESTVFAQNEPVMYFCDNFGRNRAVGISDRRITGYLTIVVKSDYVMGLDDVAIQLDKYSYRKAEFEYYKKFHYTIDTDMKYVFFSKNDESDLDFEDPGIYRVFLLDERDRTVASALIEIIP